MNRFVKRSVFKKIPKVDVIYFDKIGEELFCESTLKSFNYFVLPCRQEEYWINARVLFRAICWLPKIFRRRKHLNLPVRGVITVSYFSAVVEESQCRVMVTFVDNAKLFQSLTLLFPQIRSIAIQNGTRWYHGYSLVSRPFKFDYLLSFGQFEGDLLRLMDVNVLSCIPVGSARLAAAGVTVGQKNDLVFDLCFISQLRKGSLDSAVDVNGHILSQRVLCEYLARFLAGTKLTMVVCLVGSGEWEKKFYENYFDSSPNVTIAPNKQPGKSVYMQAASSKVVLGFNSTVLSEMFGLLKKVMFCNAGPCVLYDFPMEYPYGLRRPGFEMFQIRLLELLAMDQRDFEEKYREIAGYTMNQREASPPTVVLADLVQKILTSTPAAGI